MFNHFEKQTVRLSQLLCLLSDITEIVKEVVKGKTVLELAENQLNHDNVNSILLHGACIPRKCLKIYKPLNMFPNR